MFKYDLRNGMWQRRVWLILPIAFFGMALCAIAPYIRSSEYNITLGGALFKLLEGTLPVNIGGFHVPIEWLMLQLGCIFFTVEYPTRDMNNFGQQIMIRGKGKGLWLMSKYAWNLLSVITYWLIGYIMFIVFCAIYKVPMTLGVDCKATSGIMIEAENLQEYYPARNMVLLLVIMPVLVSVAISFIQMFVAIMLNDIFAVTVSVFILVWSMCMINPLAIGNYSMMQRSDMFISSQGLNFKIGIVIILVIIAATVTLNYVLFKNKDILEPKKNGEWYRKGYKKRMSLTEKFGAGYGVS